MSKSSEEGAGGNLPPQDPGAENGAQKDGSIYENRPGTKKIIRVVTVMAYVFSVSFAAILLSAYYVFLWEPPNPNTIQRHPLTGDPQAEYLTDNLMLNSNLKELNKSEDQSMVATDAENPSANLNILKRIMSREKEEMSSEPQKLVALPQNLFAYEDFLKLNYHAASEGKDSFADAVVTSSTATIENMQKLTGSSESTSSTLTTLPIFFKPYTTTLTQLTESNGAPATPLSLEVILKRTLTSDGSGKIGEDKLVDDKNVNPFLGTSTPSLFNRGRKFVFWKNSAVARKRSEKRNESRNIELPLEVINTETTAASSELNTLASASTEDLETTIYPGSDNYSYPEAIGETVNNEVTIGDFGTTEAPTSPLPAAVVVPELEENFETSMRKHESTLSPNPDDTDSTRTPEVQIYPAEKVRDILKNRK